MDFIFRALYEKNSTSSIPPPPPIYTYLTAIQCNNASSSAGGYNHLTGNQAAMYHRQLEKEKIREHILAEEAAWRRELEAEVRRELMVERELELRRRAVDHQLALQRVSHHQQVECRSFKEMIALSTQERLNCYPLLGQGRIQGLETEMPFQRAVQPVINEVNPPSYACSGKEKELIFLTKDDASLLGTKRKSVTLQKVGVSEVTKKLKEEWSCALCQVSATNECGLIQHLQGKKHKARATRLTTEKIGKTGLGSKNNCNLIKPDQVGENHMSEPKNKNKLNPCEVSSVVSSTKNEAPLVENNKITRDINEESGETIQKMHDGRKINFKFWCEMCQKGAFSEKVMNNHKKGKKHVFRLNKLSSAGEVVEDTRTFHESQRTSKDKLVDESPILAARTN